MNYQCEKGYILAEIVNPNDRSGQKYSNIEFRTLKANLLTLNEGDVFLAHENSGTRTVIDGKEYILMSAGSVECYKEKA